MAQKTSKVSTVTGQNLNICLAHYKDSFELPVLHGEWLQAQTFWSCRCSCPSMCGLPSNPRDSSSVNVPNQACAVFTFNIKPPHRAYLALETHWLSVLSYPVHNSVLKPLSTEGCRQTAIKGDTSFEEKKKISTISPLVCFLTSITVTHWLSFLDQCKCL